MYCFVKVLLLSYPGNPGEKKLYPPKKSEDHSYNSSMAKLASISLVPG